MDVVVAIGCCSCCCCNKLELDEILELPFEIGDSKYLILDLISFSVLFGNNIDNSTIVKFFSFLDLIKSSSSLVQILCFIWLSEDDLNEDEVEDSDVDIGDGVDNEDGEDDIDIGNL